MLRRQGTAIVMKGLLLLTLGVPVLTWGAPSGTKGSRDSGAADSKAPTLTQVADVPFDAVQVITRRDGTEAKETRGRMARNAEGSTYVELQDSNGSVVRILILDVPQRRQIVLDVPCRCYRVRAAPELVARSLTSGWMLRELEEAAGQKNASRHELMHGNDSTVTPLGTRRVSGLETIGSREIRHAPETGDVREMESWFSVDLGLAVLMTERGAVRGDETEVMLTEILRSEPDPSLFRIPEGYVPEVRRPVSRAPASGF